MKKEDSNNLSEENEKLRKRIKQLEQTNHIYKEIIDKLPFGIEVYEGDEITHHFNPKKEKQINLLNLENEIQNFLDTSEYLRNFYENAPLPYQSLDDKGCFIDVNQTWLETLDYEKEEIIGKCFKDFLHPDWKPHFEKNFPEFKKRGSIRGVQFQLKHKKGHYLKVSFQGCVGYEPDGSFRQTYCVFKDITEQDRMEQELKESEEQYRKIVENINDAMVIHDKDGTITFVNDNACHLLGYEKDELISANIVSFHAPESKEFLSKVIENQSWYEKAFLEQNLISKEGSQIPVEVSVRQVRSKYKTEIHAFVRDISERKEAEKAAKKSEKDFRLLFEHSPLGIYIADTEGNLIDANEALIKMLGSPSIEETRKINVLTFPLLVEAGYADAFRQTVVSGSVQFGEHPYISKWGKRGYFSSYIIPLKNQNGEVEKVYTLVEDITERKKAEEALKESEEKFRSFVKTTTDGIRLVDKDGRIFFTNEAHARLTGYSAEEVEGTYVWDLAFKLYPDEKKTPENYVQLKHRLTKVIKGRESYPFNKPNLITVQTKQGEKRDLQEVAVKIPTLHGFRYGATIRDITRLKKQEEKLRELNSTKDKFFSIISHDLRNPFHAILGFSQLILEALQKDKMDNIEKYATEIYKSAHHSYNLLNNLLDWSRVQRGTMAFEPQEVELKSIVDKTINLLKVNSDSKNIFLESSFDPGLKVYGDRFMLETVMRNLISNAIKYTPKGGKIHLTAKRKKDKTLLSVKDNGLGIKQENLEKLFRIEDSFSTKGTEKEQGTGLGLILCKEFVEKHGGEIWVDSEVNKGTTFYVSIPDRG